MVTDLGQVDDKDLLYKRAIAAGASNIYIEDVREEFIQDYIFSALKANALYGEGYLLSTALSRPLIAKKIVERAKSEGIDTVAHGCTRKGNDRIRFRESISALNPTLNILEPACEWEIKDRNKAIGYALNHGIPLSIDKRRPYSIDNNLWGVSIEGEALEDTVKEPPEDIYKITVSPREAPDNELYMEIGFEKGIPVKINGKFLSPIEMINKLNKIGGLNGIGRIDMIEDRIIGLKSREIYEAPAATILYKTHKALESLVLSKDMLHLNEMFSFKYAELIYTGKWHSPLKKTLDAFIEKSQEKVTGKVKIKLYKGNIVVIGRKSKYSLCHERFSFYR
ncbi:MAG: argininosuccinate synthase [Nitrospirae bacterium]|nr:argininosuccinate synthase [Nitrospirota bacterium]